MTEAAGPTTVLATHHLEEIPPTTTHAALLRDGRVLAAGAIDEVLVDERLSACFGMPIVVEQCRRPVDRPSRGLSRYAVSGSSPIGSASCSSSSRLRVRA